jgi:hypothetical protein
VECRRMIRNEEACLVIQVFGSPFWDRVVFKLPDSSQFWDNRGARHCSNDGDARGGKKEIEVVAYLANFMVV